MSEMAPEQPVEGEPVDVEVSYVWDDPVLKVDASLSSAKASVVLDWGQGDPGADLEVLLSALPQILIQVHQSIDSKE